MTEKLGTKERLDIGRRIVVFIGPEGSGKTTQAERLAAESESPIISTSGILHKLRTIPGPLGDEVRNMFFKNEYLNGMRLLELVGGHLKEREDITAKQRVIVDGGMRSIDETAGFQQMLESVGIFIPLMVVYLQIPEEISYRRLLYGRRRPDDTPEGIAKRLAKFNDGLEDRLAIIKRQRSWSLVEIDASGPVEEVYGSVCEMLTT